MCVLVRLVCSLLLLGGPPPTQLTRGSPSKNRPVSGAFTLDLEKIESQVDRQLGEQGIRLVNHNLDEIFNDEPVMLPETVTKSAHPHHRQFSPSSALPHNQHHYNNHQQQQHQQQQQLQLTDNPEAYEALDVVLSQILNQDAGVCISALKQIDELIKDSEKVKLLGAGQRMDQFLQACYMQYR